MAGWIGVDFDGTLAKYPPEPGKQLGDPVPLMLERVKRMLAEGREVRILTARVGMADLQGEEMIAEQVRLISEWCQHYLGTVLRVTAEKDYFMVECYDDRAIQIIPNTGRRADGGN